MITELAMKQGETERHTHRDKEILREDFFII